ncbi:MAG: ribosomal protein S18-alanine N-acetyltransferase [Dehalococcoidia bacterium]|nr:ribosomal protein S18-alanine N-acetyltransferase [Dehalococcoidia bacterium]
MLWDDIAQVRGIDLNCFPTMVPPTNYETEFVNPMAYYLVAYDKDIAPPEDISGRKSQKVLGFIGLWYMASEMHIINLAVHPDYRLLGVGELLLICGIGLSMELKAILMTLEVRLSNLAAQALYAKYGFSERGVRRAYYLDNSEDAGIMTLDNMYTPEYKAALHALKIRYLQTWKKSAEDTSFIVDMGCNAAE